MSKNPMTPAGIELATFGFVAQHLNHCATAVPGDKNSMTKYWLISLLTVFLRYSIQLCAVD